MDGRTNTIARRASLRGYAIGFVWYLKPPLRNNIWKLRSVADKGFEEVFFGGEGTKKIPKFRNVLLCTNKIAPFSAS